MTLPSDEIAQPHPELVTSTSNPSTPQTVESYSLTCLRSGLPVAYARWHGLGEAIFPLLPALSRAASSVLLVVKLVALLVVKLVALFVIHFLVLHLIEILRCEYRIHCVVVQDLLVLVQVVV